MFSKLTQKISEIQAKTVPVSRSDSKYPIACVVMAAGVASRYQLPDPALIVPEEPEEEGKQGKKKKKPVRRGTVKPDNKLTADFRGKPMLTWVLDSLSQLDCAARIVVVREFETAELISEEAFRVVWNSGKDTSPSKTIQYGLMAAPEDVTGCLFAVGDQPQLTKESVEKLCETFMADPEKIVMLSWEGQPGNPVIFPRSLFGELLTLGDGEAGKAVIQRHPELVVSVEAVSEQELRDIDTKAELREAQV